APGAELREKLRSFGARAEAGGRGAVQVARGAWPAPAAAAFRSGWVRSPELSAPHLSGVRGRLRRPTRGLRPGRLAPKRAGRHGLRGPRRGQRRGQRRGRQRRLGRGRLVAKRLLGGLAAALGRERQPSLPRGRRCEARGLARQADVGQGRRPVAPPLLCARRPVPALRRRAGRPVEQDALRRPHSRVGLSAGDPCEIELELASRVWRLRAEDPSAARQWLVLLQAARLLGSRAPAGEGGAEGAAPSGSGTPRSPGTPSFGGAGHAAGGRVSVPEVDQEAAAAAAHRLSRAAGALAPRLASRPPRAGARALGEQLGPGLDAALDALWQRLAALAAPPGAPGSRGQALRQRPSAACRRRRRMLWTARWASTCGVCSRTWPAGSRQPTPAPTRS
ncbi:unnamed protein product, partial [Prorocentrum cordatum]